ncbi:4'-phosphopantetheinyl transferase family protein [Thalassotalea piscium]
MNDSVYVFYFSTQNLSEKFFIKAKQWLSPQELQVLAKRNGQQRTNFLASRYCLKQLIANQFKCDLIDVTICFNEKDKKISAFLNSTNLPFSISISHKDNRLLIALSLTPSVLAVDLENISKNRDFLSIAQQVFSKQEYDEMKHVGDLNFYFYQLWTLKECLVKATGQSLVKILGINTEQELKHQKLNFSTFVENDYIGTLLYSQYIVFNKVHFIKCLKFEN